MSKQWNCCVADRQRKNYKQFKAVNPCELLRFDKKYPKLFVLSGHKLKWKWGWPEAKIKQNKYCWGIKLKVLFNILYTDKVKGQSYFICF